MKCANLYATTDRNVAAQCDGGYQQAYVPGWGYLFIRAELLECSVAETLDHMKPRDGETFLNGIPLDDEARA